MTSIGAMFRREYPVQLLADYARQLEAAGYDELWVVEDLGYHGGFTQATAALAATSRLTVGLGIAPAVARNAAFAAMEVATLAHLFPGRFHMGIGHGVDHWIAQVGATPASWVGSLEEVTVAVKGLVGGETVTMSGSQVHLDNVRLVHPVTTAAPLVSLGVRRPKSLALAARRADGVILAEHSGPEYIRQTRATVGSATRITVFVIATTDEAGARAEVAARVAEGFTGQLAPYSAADGDLTATLAISGAPRTWTSQARRWIEAGADAIVFSPLPSDPPEALADLVAALAP